MFPLSFSFYLWQVPFAFFHTVFNIKVLHAKFLVSHCVGVSPELLNGPLMGHYQDLGRILIDREWNIVWSTLITSLLCRDPTPDLNAAVNLSLMLWSLVDFKWKQLAKMNPLHPNISMYFLHNVLYTFSKVLRRRICLTIKNFLTWWSVPPFLQP